MSQRKPYKRKCHQYGYISDLNMVVRNRNRRTPMSNKELTVKSGLGDGLPRKKSCSSQWAVSKRGMDALFMQLMRPHTLPLGRGVVGFLLWEGGKS